MAVPSATQGNYPGSGAGVSGPAFATASPRPQPLQVAATQDGPAPAELRAAWAAYNDGRFADGDDALLAAQAGVPDLNVKSNRLKPIINTGVDFLFGPGLSLRVADQEANEDADAPGQKTGVHVSDAAQQAQQQLDATFGDDDERMTRFAKMGINGGVYGHVFVKVVEPRRGRASVVSPPRLVILNPETVSVFTDPEDADLVTRYRIEYATQDAQGAPCRKRQEITRVDPDDDDDTTANGHDADTTWSVQNFVASGMSAGRFQPVGPAVVWPYALPPVVDWQNYPNPQSHWGQRDITASLMALNRQLRLVESNINKIGFLQGHPYLYSVGADTGGLKPTPGAIIDLGAPDSKLAAVNAAGDLGQLMAFAEQLRSDMDEESGVPGVATGRMQDLPRGQMSGVTVRLLYAPLLARNEHKRRLYGQGIRQLAETILLVCGVAQETVDNLDIQLGWQDPLPTDDLAMAQTAVALQQIGYSEHTLIDRTGGDPDVEAQWKSEEQQAQTASVLQGKALPTPLFPPATPGQPGQPGQPPATPTNGATDKQAAQDRPATAALDPNHPAAQMARAKASIAMKAAFGKPAKG